MEQETETDNMGYVLNLPDEVISIILASSECRDIINFGSTCKRFNNLVNNDQHLWKAKFKSFMPEAIYEIVEQHCNGDWLQEIKQFTIIKNKLVSELLDMSAQYFWRQNDISLEDIRNFFSIALTSNVSYYYTIMVLQDILRTGVKYVDEGRCEKPYTLTEMHYTKVVLRHLIQTFLALKWVMGHIKNELSPEVVLNFFLQWTDTDNLHADEDVVNRIMEVVQKVEALLQASMPPSKESIQHQCAKGQISERRILDAVTQVIYQEPRHMAVTHGSNLDTLDIIKVLENRCGSVISVATIFQAVAKRFGVTCELVAFPNHLFVEWRDTSEYRFPVLHTVDIATGELHPKRQCPFSQNVSNMPSNNYSYSPDAFLQYIYVTYHMTMGAIKNWNTQNALHLMDFLGIYDSDNNPYRYFLPFLLDRTDLPAMTTTLNLKYITDDQLNLMSSLANLNPAMRTVNRNMTVKMHDSRVKFAVGMICYHRKYDYVCIIRGWDVTCEADMEWQRRGTLDLGPKQPFYNVIAADQSERYVAQENLTEVAHPTRLYHLEDLIGREFTHFDGFSYVPNDEKRAEYPKEDPIINTYILKCGLRPEARMPAQPYLQQLRQI